MRQRPFGTLPALAPSGCVVVNAKRQAVMLKIVRLAVLCILSCAPAIASAQDCAPHCDYVHDYGPYDYSWVSPGLVGYPICDRAGNCLPHLVYRKFGHPGPGITIRVRPTPPNGRVIREQTAN